MIEITQEQYDQLISLFDEALGAMALRTTTEQGYHMMLPWRWFYANRVLKKPEPESVRWIIDMMIDNKITLHFGSRKQNAKIIEKEDESNKNNL